MTVESAAKRPLVRTPELGELATAAGMPRPAIVEI